MAFLTAFQAAVKRLSDRVKGVTLWNDSKYRELSASVSKVASESKTVAVTGDRCCSSIGKFFRIAAERY